MSDGPSSPEGARQAETGQRQARPLAEVRRADTRTRRHGLTEGFTAVGPDGSNSVQTRLAVAEQRLAGTPPLPTDERLDLKLQVAEASYWLGEKTSQEIRSDAEDILFDRPTDADAHALIGLVIARDANLLPKSDKQDTEAVATAKENARRTQFEEARQKFRETLTHDPDNALANLFLNTSRKELTAAADALRKKANKDLSSLTTEDRLQLHELDLAIDFQTTLGIQTDLPKTPGRLNQLSARAAVGLTLAAPPATAAMYAGHYGGPREAIIASGVTTAAEALAIGVGRVVGRGRRRMSPPASATTGPAASPVTVASSPPSGAESSSAGTPEPRRFPWLPRKREKNLSSERELADVIASAKQIDSKALMLGDTDERLTAIKKVFGIDQAKGELDDKKVYTAIKKTKDGFLVVGGGNIIQPWLEGDTEQDPYSFTATFANASDAVIFLTALKDASTAADALIELKRQEENEKGSIPSLSPRFEIDSFDIRSDGVFWDRASKQIVDRVRATQSSASTALDAPTVKLPIAPLAAPASLVPPPAIPRPTPAPDRVSPSTDEIEELEESATPPPAIVPSPRPAAFGLPDDGTAGKPVGTSGDAPVESTATDGEPDLDDDNDDGAFDNVR